LLLKSFEYLSYGFFECFIRQWIIDERTTNEQFWEIVDSQSDSFFRLYAVQIIEPLFSHGPDSSAAFLQPFGGNWRRRIAVLVACFNRVPQFQFQTTEAQKMLNQCANAIEKSKIFWIWAKSVGDGGFDEVFALFMQSLGVHLSSDQKVVCEAVRIPKSADLTMAARLIGSRIKLFLRYPGQLLGVWQLLRNNIDVFQQPQMQFWRIVVTQVADLHRYAITPRRRRSPRWLLFSRR
jgi:hypothetical protein